MKEQTALALLAALLSFPAPPALAADPASAKDVMTRNEEARKLQDVTASASLVTGGPTGSKTKTFTWWRKLKGDGVRYDTLTRFLSPAEVRGEAILFLEHENDRNDVQMYLPAYKKIRRVESQQQSGSFMGSEFSYADIATPHVDDYKQALLPEADCEIDGGAKARCFVIESVPATDAVKERTGYSKTVQWLRKDCFMVVKGEFYDLEGKLKKKLASSEIKEVDPKQHKWMAHFIRIENASSGKTTELRFSGVKVNTGIADSTFTPQNLSKAR